MIKRFLTSYPFKYLYDYYFYYLLKGQIRGLSHLPKGGYILAFNHSSYLDWFLIHHIFQARYNKDIYFLGKSKLISSPIWRMFLEYSKTIVIDYDDNLSVIKAYKNIIRYLKEGKIVGLFPEGTRSPDGKIMEAKPGIAKIMLKSNVPIVPVGLKGFYEAWPKHKKLPGISKCQVYIGKPIYPQEYSNEKDKKAAQKAVTDRLMSDIALLVNS